jgi:CO/xanthine dehydrogenase FAD-binding subunit
LAGDLSETAIQTAARMTVEGALPLSDNAYKAHLPVNLIERAIYNSLPN